MSQVLTRNPALPWVCGAAAASVALGIAITINVQVAFLLVVALIGLAALAAPAGAWVLCALIAAMTFRGLVQIHVVPSAATFIDLPLAWGALLVALLKRGDRSRLLTRHLHWLALLALAVALAWIFHPSEALRPVLYLTLLGEPFAIVGALLAEPPSPRMRRTLERTLLLLVLIQIPIAALQLVTLGPSDSIQGTLYGAGAGAHVISAVLVVGGIWLLSGAFKEQLGAARIPIVVLLFLIPFVADAKQVIVALPAIALATSWSVGRMQFLVRGVLVVASVVALFTLAPAGDATQRFLQESEKGQGGKQATALLVWHQLDTGPDSLVFGKGPAETVSRAAFMTTDLFQGEGSALEVLHLRPATLATTAAQTALATSGGGTSLNTGTSSALGVVGDLGVFGLAAYLGLFFSVFLRLRKIGSPEGVAAACGFALLLVLGLIDAWWEQPPVGLFVAVLAGLALTGAQNAQSAQGSVR